MYISISISVMQKNCLMLLAALLWATAAGAIVPPTMGWASWNAYRVNISEEIICHAADEMAENGLLAAGYDHICIDDGFFGGRLTDGTLLAHPVRFPRGLRPVVEHVHALGFRAGIYSDAGRNTCGNYWDHDSIAEGVGLYGHDRRDARFYFRRMGFDYIKVDFCGGDPGQNTEHLDLDERERYTAIRRAIDRTRRKDVRMDVCRWGFPGTWVHRVGHAWRISADIRPTWNSIRDVLGKNRYLSAFADGRGYNDMDMLVIGFGLPEAEERTHFGMWCIQSSPLLIGCRVETLPRASLRLLCNRELIALNQDPLGLQARVVRTEDSVYLYVKDIETLNGRRRAVALCNLGDVERTFTLRMSDVDLAGRVLVRDLFACQDLPSVSDGSLTVTLPPHDTRIFRLQADVRLERTLYEAETAWLERFQDIGLNPQLGYATYEDAPACSGGGRVSHLGHHPCNWLEWRDVYSREGGLYDMTLRYLPAGDLHALLTINGARPLRLDLPARASETSSPATVTVRIKLKKGRNVIRLSNPTEWIPDLDCMMLKRVGKPDGADKSDKSDQSDQSDNQTCPA